jgi:hypothetical protein
MPTTGLRACRACRRDISELRAPRGPQAVYCKHSECIRERSRARKRKQRGPQWVIVEWTDSSTPGGRERVTHVGDALPREKGRSIVNLDLSREPDPEDEGGLGFDRFVTAWLVATAEKQTSHGSSGGDHVRGAEVPAPRSGGSAQLARRYPAPARGDRVAGDDFPLEEAAA